MFGLHLVVFFPAFSSYLVNHLVAQGGTGVSFFFILSGFVLTWSHRKGDPARWFYRRRIARILPSHVVVWILTWLLVSAVLVLPSKKAALAQLLLVSPWIPNVHTVGVMNVPAWSLGCEVFFYSLFPLAITRLSRYSASQRRVRLGALVFAMLAIAAATSPAVYPTHRYWAVYFFPVARLPEFLFGMLLALEVSAGSWPRIRVSGAAAVAAVAYLGAGWVAWPYSVTAITVIPFSVLIAAAAQRDTSGEPVAGPGLLASPMVVRLGVWSYAFYLIHWPVLIAITHLYPDPKGLAGSVAISVGAFAVALAMAVVVHTAVERPFESLLRGNRGTSKAWAANVAPRRLLVPLMAGTSVIGIGGVAVAAVSHIHRGPSAGAVVDSLAPLHGNTRISPLSVGSGPATAPSVATSVSGSPNPNGSGPIATPTPIPNASGPGSPPNGHSVLSVAACSAADLVTTALTDRGSYLAGQPVNITLTVTNISNAPCDLEPPPGYPEIVVQSVTGSAIWTYCGPGSALSCTHGSQLVPPGGAESISAAWNPTAVGLGTTVPSTVEVTGTWLGSAQATASPVKVLVG